MAHEKIWDKKIYKNIRNCRCEVIFKIMHKFNFFLHVSQKDLAISNVLIIKNLIVGLKL